MMTNVSDYNYDLFLKACNHEPVFGTRCFTQYQLNPHNIFLQIGENNHPSTVLFIQNGVAVVASDNTGDVQELAQFLAYQKVKEVDTNLVHCEQLKAIMGGTTESSFYMQYNAKQCGEMARDIYPAMDLYEVFQVLQQSHEYYRTHFQFDSWSADIVQKLEAKVMELYVVYHQGKPVGTGAIIAKSPQHEVIAAVAVIPEFRHQKLGTKISQFLTQQIVSRNKTPVLISGYDAVANLYESIGYKKMGRWGELYLP